ncbi:hypothetical protein L1987_46269 [Smallanthus sonchifolius]|uniref:Uncharacterized protein n=1 Tax=Smallanthus sonchifolius TaxID=185202 RepID=A0ACB9FYP5_9ASTR|nr:hypothetical protein L1987_46269 [Smallanthus sonchifolius]
MPISCRRLLRLTTISQQSSPSFFDHPTITDLSAICAVTVVAPAAAIVALVTMPSRRLTTVSRNRHRYSLIAQPSPISLRLCRHSCSSSAPVVVPVAAIVAPVTMPSRLA